MEENKKLSNLDCISNYLNSKGWTLKKREKGLEYRFEIPGKHLKMVCFAGIRKGTQQFHFIVQSEQKAPSAVRMQIARWIARINFATKVGNFELDFSDGEIRYKNFLNFGVQLSSPMIDNVIQTSLDAMVYYWPSFLDIMQGISIEKTLIQHPIKTQATTFDDLTVKIGGIIQPQVERDADNPSPSYRTYANLVNFLVLSGSNPFPLDDKSGCRTTSLGENIKSLTVYIHVEAETNEMISYTISPRIIPEKQLEAILELITRLNFGLYLGHFDLNMATGQLRYRTGISFKDVESSTDLIKHVVYTGVLVMDKYWPTLEQVIDAKLSVLEAYQQIRPNG